MSQVTDRFKEYPPLLQWLLVLSAVFFVVVMWRQFVWGTALSWDDRSAEYQAAIKEADKTQSDVPKFVILAIGKAERLSNKVDGSKALSATIADVLKEFPVSGTEIKGKGAMKFGGKEMTSLVGTGKIGEKLMTEVRFEASQKRAYEVIAALEQSPKIETVKSVQVMKKQSLRPRDSNTVVVRLTVEAWVLSPKPRRSTGSGRGVNP